MQQANEPMEFASKKNFEMVIDTIFPASVSIRTNASKCAKIFLDILEKSAALKQFEHFKSCLFGVLKNNCIKIKLESHLINFVDKIP